MADNRFQNRARLLKKLKAIPAAVRAAVRAEMDAQAACLVEQIRPAVPRDHGDLADSLEWRRNLRGDKIGVIITEGGNDPSARDGKPGSKARAVEFGRPDMAAQPHFFPIYRANKRRIRAAVIKAARNAIRKEFGGS